MYTYSNMSSFATERWDATEESWNLIFAEALDAFLQIHKISGGLFDKLICDWAGYKRKE